MHAECASGDLPVFGPGYMYAQLFENLRPAEAPWAGFLCRFLCTESRSQLQMHAGLIRACSC